MQCNPKDRWVDTHELSDCSKSHPNVCHSMFSATFSAFLLRSRMIFLALWDYLELTGNRQSGPAFRGRLFHEVLESGWGLACFGAQGGTCQLSAFLAAANSSI